MSNLIGTAPDQVPVNGMLGELAFQDTDSVKITDLTYTGTLTGSTGILNIGSGQLYKDASGNVGIGTSSPVNQLNVVTTSNSVARQVGIRNFSNGSSAYTLLDMGNDITGLALEFGVMSSTNTSYSGANGGAILANAGGLFIETTTAYPLQFGTNGSERMRIDASGNVGIGTSSPSAKLAVSGDLKVNGATAVALANSMCVDFSSGGRLLSYGTNTSTYNPILFSQVTSDGNFYTERMRIDSSGNVGIGTVSNAGNTLRYLDIQNTDTGASAGAIIRLITNNSASTAVTTADIVKYKNGLFSINNNDTGQIALNIAGSNRLYINSGESMILRSTVGSTAGYDSYHTNINGMSLAINRFTSSNGDIGDWPTPVLAIKGYDSNFHGLTMQTFGSRDDNAGYQTGSAIWNIRLWNDAGGTWTTSNSSTSMEVKGPGPYRIQAGAANGVQLTNGATSWTAWSDENMKDIIEPITDALQKVSTLRTVIGKYKKEADGIRRPFLIAQDVEKVLPEAVTVSIERDEINPDDIYAELEQRERLLLSYTDVIPLLTASIKELKIIIDTQQEQINIQQQQINTLLGE